MIQATTINWMRGSRRMWKFCSQRELRLLNLARAARGTVTLSRPFAFTATAAKASKPSLWPCKMACWFQSFGEFGLSMMVNQQGRGGKLLSGSIKPSALGAERFSAGSLPEIFGFDIVTGVAVRIIVMDILLS